MANEKQLSILKQGAGVWNNWWDKNRQAIIDGSIKLDLSGAVLRGAVLDSVNLFGVDLKGADLSNADLGLANLGNTDLTETKLTDAILYGVNFGYSILNGTNLCRADLNGANFIDANLSHTQLTGAILSETNLSFQDFQNHDLRGTTFEGANLTGTNFTNSNLAGSNLSRALLIDTIFSQADLLDGRIFVLSAWNVKLVGVKQTNLTSTKVHEFPIVIDNVEVAQFVYLLLNNPKLRNVIDTVGKKSVLILGRFALPERKEILEAMRSYLREKGYLPIVFDFEGSEERDFTETIKILAGMSLFVIADITNPKSSPLELQGTIPDYMIPFVPIIQVGEQPFSMFADLQHKYKGVLEVRQYNDKAHLLSNFEGGIMRPALVKHEELLALKNEALKIGPIDEFSSRFS